MDKEQNTFDELYRRVYITSKNRFNASERLAHKNIVALCTITVMSFGLIAVPLIDILALRQVPGTGRTEFFQLFLSIVVLVISVAINSANFGKRSEKLHECGIELSTFARKVYVFVKDNGSAEQYNLLVDSYSRILNRYENHKAIDFSRTKLDLPEQYPRKWWTRILVTIGYLLNFLPYLFLIAVEIIWIYVLLQ